MGITGENIGRCTGAQAEDDLSACEAISDLEVPTNPSCYASEEEESYEYLYYCVDPDQSSGYESNCYDTSGDQECAEVRCCEVSGVSASSSSSADHHESGVNVGRCTATQADDDFSACEAAGLEVPTNS